MASLIKLLERTATKRGFTILLGLYAIVFGLILVTMSKLAGMSGGRGILDMEFGYSTEKVLDTFASYGGEGMALYLQILMLDIFNPAIYALVFATIMFVLLRKGRFVWAVILPLLAGALDYAENIALFYMATSNPDISDRLVGIGSALSVVKHSVMGIFVVAFLAAIVMWIRARRAGQGDVGTR